VGSLLESPTAEATAAWRRPHPAARALIYAPVAALAVLAWMRRWSSEDAYIYFRVADNLLAGHGPVFNIGERVEAYTGPLWLAVLTVGRAIVPDRVAIEWIAVGLGLVLTVAGLAAAVAGAWRLWAPRAAGAAADLDGRGTPLALPLGALVIAALPPFWDFATSGLETGLAFGWLGGSFLGLVVLREASAAGRTGAGWRRHAPYALAAAIGLGPLVRPDLALVAAVFLVLLVVVDRPRSALRAGGLVAAAVLLPLAHQILRMGYFAALSPNTALAKEAGAAFWGRGFAYLLNFIDPSALWIGVAPLLAFAAWAGRGLWRGGERERALLVAGPILAGALHALFVVRVGGDYMHARLLLPSLFAALLPVAVVVTSRRVVAAALAAVVVPWALVCGLSLRAHSQPPKDRKQLQTHDERRRYARWGYAHPVTLADLAVAPGRRVALQARQGYLLRSLAGRRRAVVLAFSARRNDFGERERVPLPLTRVVPRPNLPERVVALAGSVGRVGYAAGPDVYIADANGLADVIAARMRLPRYRTSYPGHEKYLPPAWVLARFAVPATPAGARWLETEPQVVAARRALACRPLRDLIAATSAPLTPERFLDNAAYAVRSRSLRFSDNPLRAERQLCGPARPPGPPSSWVRRTWGPEEARSGRG
jgi:arabinofuranosyltransferase